MDCIYFETVFNDFVSNGGTIKIVVQKKTTIQLYFKTFIEKINTGNLIM